MPVVKPIDPELLKNTELRTQNLTLCWDTRKSEETGDPYGRIYFRGKLFANLFSQGGDWFPDGQKRWCINRDSVAMALGAPQFDALESPLKCLDAIEKFLLEIGL